jgi:hypothetical protein
MLLLCTSYTATLLLATYIACLLSATPHASACRSARDLPTISNYRMAPPTSRHRTASLCLQAPFTERVLLLQCASNFVMKTSAPGGKCTRQHTTDHYLLNTLLHLSFARSRLMCRPVALHTPSLLEDPLLLQEDDLEDQAEVYASFTPQHPHPHPCTHTHACTQMHACASGARAHRQAGCDGRRPR